jgi:transposase
LKKTKNFVGIDVSSETIDVAFYRPNEDSVSAKEPFSNDIEGFDSVINWLNSNGIKQDTSIICLEITGVYSEAICYYFHKKGYKVWAEAPHKVHRAFYKQMKNDKASSIQIAEYGYRFLDHLLPFEPNEDITDEVQTLLTTREQLVEHRTANKNILQALKRKQHKSNLSIKVLESTIVELDRNIIEIEKELKKLIYNNQKYSKIAIALDSIPGIALLFVANFFTITNGFQNSIDYKKLASFLGICPHDCRSGTSVYKKPKSSGYGHKRLRKLLYLASMSVRNHSAKYSNYFVLKVNQGKNDKLVLNNISNKLLKLVCAIAKSGVVYNSKYESVHPKFLKIA